MLASVDIPPELMLPEQRAARVAELERVTGREWLRYTLLETVLVFVPFFCLVLFAVPDRISMNVAIGIGIGLVFVVSTPLLIWTIVKRVRPLQQELDELRRLSGLPPLTDSWEG